jgi:polysaccharide pyruvyl transferase WcaK-like protein
MQTILIIGGNFINKGAESMLLSTVAGIRQYFPGYEPVMVDLFPTLNEKAKEKFDFRIVNMHVRTLFRIYFPVLRLFFKAKPISNRESEIKDLFGRASALFDISGYGLSSHNQALLWSVAYLLPIGIAKKNRIPVWLLPQSFGPFRFRGIRNILFQRYGKPLLNYPGMVFVREPSGLIDLERVRKNESMLSSDIVLQNSGDIYDECKTTDEVIIIPNKQLFKIVEVEIVLEFYVKVISEFLNRDFPVRVIRHSLDDLDFCRLISERVSHKLLKIQRSEMSLKSLIDVIGSARFVVSGRYHGAVHALKCGKPAIIIGWAEKYNHLASLFGISDFMVDLCMGATVLNPSELVDRLVNREKDLHLMILKNLKKIEKNSFWNYIKLEK